MKILDMPRLMRYALVAVINKTDPLTIDTQLTQLALHLGQKPPKA